MDASMWMINIVWLLVVVMILLFANLILSIVILLKTRGGLLPDQKGEETPPPSPN